MAGGNISFKFMVLNIGNVVVDFYVRVMVFVCVV